jgi:hypothetical protein
VGSGHGVGMEPGGVKENAERVRRAVRGSPAAAPRRWAAGPLTSSGMLAEVPVVGLSLTLRSERKCAGGGSDSPPPGGSDWSDSLHPGGSDWSDSLHPGGSDWSDSLQSAHPSPASYRPATAQNIRFQGVFLKGNILESGQSFWHEVCRLEKCVGGVALSGPTTFGFTRDGCREAIERHSISACDRLVSISKGSRPWR